MQKHFWFVSSFEHVNFAINEKYSKKHYDNPNYYASFVIFQTYKNVILKSVHSLCRNLNFGIATKAKGLQGCGPWGSPGVTSHTPGSVGKCEGVPLTLPRQLPLWDSRNFREQFQESKLNGLWRFLYHWKALGT